MPVPLQITDDSEATDARPNAGGPEGHKGSLRAALLAAWDQVMGKAGHPLEAQYGPLQAATVGAGAATNSAIDQLKHKFQTGAAGLASVAGNQAEAERMRALAAQTGQQMGDEAALYEPMREAYPYATAIGEAAPAMTAPAILGQAAFNVGRTYLGDVAQASGNDYLMRLAAALRKY